MEPNTARSDVRRYISESLVLSGTVRWFLDASIEEISEEHGQAETGYYGVNETSHENNVKADRLLETFSRVHI